MSYRVRIAPLALRQMDDFPTYLSAYSEDFALEQFKRLDRILAVDLGESPLTWNYFALTGVPYRAYLFRVGHRTHYWVIYTVDDKTKTADILNFWNASRDPDILNI